MDRRTFIAALPAVAALPGGFAHGQTDFPNKPVRLVVPKTAGGTFDALGRAVGEKLSELWKQPVIVENRPGAADMLAAAYVANSADEGHTLLLGASGITQNPSLYPTMPYDPSDLAPVARLVEIPFVFAVPNSLGVSTVKEFVDWAKKADPRKRSYGAGASSAEVLGEIIKQETGLDLTRIRYRGEQPTRVALMGGEISSAIVSPAAVTSNSDRLRMIGVAGRKRLQGIEVPTLIEQGIPNTDVVSWGGIFCPATVPTTLVQKLSRDVIAVARSPEIVKRTIELGFVPAPADESEFSAFVKAEMTFWKQMIARFDIKA